MKPYTSLKSILAEFFPLHRTLVSDDHDKTLEIVGSYMPESSNYTIETYAPLKQVWTWKVPERYVVHEAYLEIEGGERIVDFKDRGHGRAPFYREDDGLREARRMTVMMMAPVAIS